MRVSGFVNYFGLQRFGRGGSKSHEIGRALIKSEWKLAVSLLFTPREGDKDDLVEAKLRFAAKDYRGALSMLPNSMHSEGYVLESLINHPEDYLGAYNRIAKNPRLICIHAYQVNRSYSRISLSHIPTCILIPYFHSNKCCSSPLVH